MSISFNGFCLLRLLKSFCFSKMADRTLRYFNGPLFLTLLVLSVIIARVPQILLGRDSVSTAAYVLYKSVLYINALYTEHFSRTFYIGVCLYSLYWPSLKNRFRFMDIVNNSAGKWASLQCCSADVIWPSLLHSGCSLMFLLFITLLYYT